MTPEVFHKKYAAFANRYGNKLSAELKKSIKAVLDDSIASIGNSRGIIDKNDKALISNLYRDARCRSHFGMSQVDDYQVGNYCLSPLLDPYLYKLKLSTSDCNDQNLLFAIIFTRYCPDLLNFRFEGGRSIDEKTICYAQNLCKSRPFSNTVVNSVEIELPVAIPKYYETNPKQSIADIEKFLLKSIDNAQFRDVFCSMFNSNIYDYARYRSCKENYYPLRHCFSVLSAIKCIQDVQYNQCLLSGKKYVAIDPIDPYDTLSHYNSYIPTFKSKCTIFIRNNKQVLIITIRKLKKIVRKLIKR